MTLCSSKAMQLIIALLALCGVTAPLSASIASETKENKRFVLVIDPGHGGRDAGAVGSITREKDINLKVAKAFGELVERNCPDVKVIYTRTTDTFVTLQERANIANRNKANLFISIHTNSLPNKNKSVQGAETYTLGMHRAQENLEVAKRENSVITQEANYQQTYHNFDPRRSESYIIFEFMQDHNMQRSVSLAKKIQSQYAQRGRNNKGVHQAGFLVLRATSMPSVLTELGFISNPDEERYMHSAEGVTELGRSLYEGFRAYRQQYADNGESENPTTQNTTDNLWANNELAAVLTTSTDAQTDDKGATSSRALEEREHAANQIDNATSPSDTTTATSPLTEEDARIEQLSRIAEVVPVSTKPMVTPIVATVIPNTPPQITPAKAVETLKQKTDVPKEKVAIAKEKADTKTETKIAKAEPNKEKADKTLTKAEKTEKTAEKTSAKTEKITPKPEKTENASDKTTKTTAKTASKAEVKKETAATKSEKTEPKATTEASIAPVFKVQILSSAKPLKNNDPAFKGLAVDSYQDGNMHKYTHGSSTNYNAIKKLRADLVSKFPEAFIVAFENGKRITLSDAIKQQKK